MSRQSVVKDQLFGVMTFDRLCRCWDAFVDLADWAKSGGCIPADDEETSEKKKRSTDPTEASLEEMGGRADSLFLQLADQMSDEPKRLLEFGREVEDVIAGEPGNDAFKLTIEVSEPNFLPTTAQRAAWKKFIENQDAILEEILRQALNVYARQHVHLRHWWKEINGSQHLDALLPSIHNIGELKEFIRPSRFILHNELAGEGGICIGIAIDASWSLGAFGAIVKDGGVWKVGCGDIAFKVLQKEIVVEHPVLGRLVDEGSGYTGEFCWEEMRRYYTVSTWDREKREQFDVTTQRVSLPDFDFIDGRFQLKVFSKGGVRNLDQRLVDDFVLFKDKLAANTDIILDSIFRYYVQYYRSPVDGNHPESAELTYPILESREDLKDHIRFQGIHLNFYNVDEQPEIALAFSCTWDEEHGLGVRWVNGRVEEVGTQDIILF